MICIFSYSRDQTTTDVMRWLQWRGRSDVIRVNSDDGEDDAPSIELAAGSDVFCFRVDGRTVQLSDIKAVWYRKGTHWLCKQFYGININANPFLSRYLKQKMEREHIKLSEYFHHVISSSVPTLGSPTTNDPNKLVVLRAAQRAGLKVPKYLVSNVRAKLFEAVRQSSCITKPISDVVYSSNDRGYYSYTEEVDLGMVTDLPELASPSLVQEQIHKLYDARVFYLNGTCYAMAIISQLDAQTKVDFRKYNFVRPNRSVPLLLPSTLQEQIKTLFADLAMTTGSIDFVVDAASNYYFLEINPVGQFAQVSNGCNYYLEKRVALILEKYAQHEA